jgi:superfamily II DNA or RNA helicase
LKRNKLSINKKKKWVIIIDEAHHVIKSNKWGKLLEEFKNSRFVGFTATPFRPTGESLHISKEGLFERLVQDENLKDDSVKKLIQRRCLSDFIVYCPPSNSYLKKNYNEIEVAENIFNVFNDKCINKKTAVICTSIKNAQFLSKDFIKLGYKAACISSKQCSTLNEKILTAFEKGAIQILFSVDMISEGFDLPEIECLILLKKTMSLVAYKQWVGRVLRYKVKKTAIIIDLVGNVNEHGMPDLNIRWDILAPPIPTAKMSHINCTKCGFYYLLTIRKCPKCKEKNKLTERDTGLDDYYCKIKNLNLGLIKKERKKIWLENIKAREKKELVLKRFRCSDFISVKITMLRDSFLDEFIKKYSFEKANTFFNSDIMMNPKMWVKNFKLTDKGNFKKINKIYKKWQKHLL